MSLFLYRMKHSGSITQVCEISGAMFFFWLFAKRVIFDLNARFPNVLYNLWEQVYLHSQRQEIHCMCVCVFAELKMGAWCWVSGQ